MATLDTEIDANLRAFEYFLKHEPGFISYENGKLMYKWDFNYFPIFKN